MNTRIQKTILALLILLSVGLGGFLLRAHATQAALLKSIEEARSHRDKAVHSSSIEQARLSQIGSEIDSLQKTLGSTPESREAMRRAAVLVVINELKEEHTRNPPIPRHKQPPSGKSGMFFDELLSDPEYNKLYAQQTRRSIKRFDGPKLRSLGLTDEACDKAVSILTDHRMVMIDYRQISGKAGIPSNFYKEETERLNQQLKEIMGPEIFNRWTALNETQTVFVPSTAGTGARGYGVRSHEALVQEAETFLTPKLATRLSYSEMPLQRAQATQLAEILANCCSKPGDMLFRVVYTDKFIEQAAQVLAPSQVQALREFQAEQIASDKRRQLPKSSELPRNMTPKP